MTFDPTTERAQRMLAALTPWEAEDPNVVAVVAAGAAELDEIQALMELARDQAWPHRADDTYGLLAIHERMLGLPVAPAGVTLADRQTAARTRVGRRRDGRKATWVDRVNELAGVGTWSYDENTPGPHQLTITLRLEPTGGLAARVRQLVEVFTPVVDEVIVGFEAGLILGVGEIGEDAM